MQKNILTHKTKKKWITLGYDCVKNLPFCLESIPEALYGGVIRRSAIRASQVPGSLANQARYGTVSWQVGHLQSSFSRSHSRSDRPKKKEKKRIKNLFSYFGIKKCGTVYILEQSAQFAFFLLCWTGLNWFMGRLGRATGRVHSASAQTSQEGIKCTKAKDTVGANRGLIRRSEYLQSNF